MSRIPVPTTPATSRSLTGDVKKQVAFVPNIFSRLPNSSAALHGYLGRQATGLRSTLAAAAVASTMLLLPNISLAQSFYAAALPEASSNYNANDRAPGISAERPKSFVELGRQAQGVDPYRNSGTASPVLNTSPAADEAKTFVERALLAQGSLERRT